MSSRARLGCLFLAATAATLALVAAPLRLAPPLTSWRALEAWYADHGPAAIAVAMVRLLGIALGAWLVVSTAMQLLAPLTRAARLRALADAMSPAFVRALARSAAGLGMAAGLAVPGLPAGPIDNGPGTAVMVPLDVPLEPATTTSTSTSTTTSTTIPEVSPPTTVPRTTAPAAVAAAPVPAPAPTPDEVVVAPGDSFWSIAVEEAGRRDLVPYWRSLIDLNRDRLVDPANEDLLYPGQALLLPQGR